MNTRPGSKPSDQKDNYPMDVITLAAYGAAANGVLLGVTAGLTLTFLQAVIRRSSMNAIRFRSLITRPLFFGTVFGTANYISAYTDISPLTMFVKHRADKEQKRMEAHMKGHESDSYHSRVNNHN